MLFGAVAGLALMANQACAEQITVTVPSTARAWDVGANSAFAFGIGDGTKPAVASGLELRAGMALKITAKGTTSAFRGGPSVGPGGQSDYIADDNPGSSGKFMPSRYVEPAQFPVKLNELIGVFVDGDGHLVGAPFPVGTEYKGLVPQGAVALQFGLNDDVLNDNSGEIVVTIEANAVLTAQDLAKPEPAPAQPAKALPPYPAVPPKPIVRHVAQNPIFADGSYYSADPAPVVVGDTLYVLAGRDEAPADGGGFVMNEWQLLSTQDVASGAWKHYPGILRPEKIFGWAAPGTAYGGQIIQGRDKKFYLYAPVTEANCHSRDCFGVGVAVAVSVGVDVGVSVGVGVAVGGIGHTGALAQRRK